MTLQQDEDKEGNSVNADLNSENDQSEEEEEVERGTCAT